MHRLALLVLVSSLTLATGIADAAGQGEVYQWKDARGVTHYSQTPPPKGVAYTARSIRHRNRGAAPEVAVTAPKPGESAQCTTARNNVEMIESGTPLQIDSNGDGTPDRDLGTQERENQLQLAKMVLRTSCQPVAATPPPPAKPKRR